MTRRATHRCLRASAALAVVVAGVGITACSDADPAPSPGGINGPARVDPDANVGVSTDE